jgi:hypothetical protein
MVGGKDGFDDGPGGLDRVFSREKRAFAGHRVTEKAVIRCFFVRLRVEQEELALVADELLTCAFDAGGDRDRCVGGEPEAEVVRRAA